MRSISLRLNAAGCCAAILLAACGTESAEPVPVLANLSQPRGLTVDESSVCVAEAGATNPEQPVSERLGQLEAQTGRVVCVSVDGGEPTVPIDRLPFVYYPDAAVTSGVSDVLRDNSRFFALVGESYGAMARSIIEVTPDGVREVADLLAYAETSGSPAGVIRSNPYSFVMAPDGTEFFVSDAATGTVLRVGLDGVVDLFAPVPGHEVLTGITWGPDGRLYVASFGQLPHPVGSGAVVAIDAAGRPELACGNLTMPIDVAFDRDGAMYVLEYANPASDPTGIDAYRDRTGRLLQYPQPCTSKPAKVLIDDLDRPTAIAISDGSIFISVTAGEQAAEEGSVVQFSLDTLLGSVTDES